MLRPIRYEKKKNVERTIKRTKKYISSQRIVIQSPLTIAFFSVCALLLLVDPEGSYTHVHFSSSAHLDLFSFSFYKRLLLHPLVHADFNHFFGNMSLFMVLSPLCEDVLGWKRLLKMIAVTSAFEGVMNALLTNCNVIGASGIVFMLVLLAPICANLHETTQTQIPLCFLIVAAMYIGKEVMEIGTNDGISHTVHIFGGIGGAVLGLYGRQSARQVHFLRRFRIRLFG